MRARWGRPCLSIPLTIALAVTAGCGSEAEPKHNAGSLHDAAQKLQPNSGELKQLDGSSMKGMPAGLKPFDGDSEKSEPEPAVAGLKPMEGKPAAGLPSGLKAFPAEPTDAPEAEPAADAEAVAAADAPEPEAEATPPEEPEPSAP